MLQPADYNIVPIQDTAYSFHCADSSLSVMPLYISHCISVMRSPIRVEALAMSRLLVSADAAFDRSNFHSRWFGGAIHRMRRNTVPSRRLPGRLSLVISGSSLIGEDWVHH